MSIGLIRSPSSLVKVGWITLTLLPKSKTINTDSFQKIIGYQINKTCTRLVFAYSPPSSFLLLTVSAISAVSTAASLAALINVEVANTNTSFLSLFWVLQILIEIITLFFVVKALDVKDVFLFSLDTINTYCKGIMSVTCIYPPRC